VLRSGKQGAGSRELEAGSRKQEARSREQEAGSREQEAGSKKQEARSRKQEAGSRKQEAGSREQEAGSRKQEAGSGKQEERMRKVFFLDSCSVHVPLSFIGRPSAMAYGVGRGASGLVSDTSKALPPCSFFEL